VSDVQGFVEAGGYVSMEAEHYSRAVGKDPVTWLRIPCLEYRIHFFGSGEAAGALLSGGRIAPGREEQTIVVVHPYRQCSSRFLGAM